MVPHPFECVTSAQNATIALNIFWLLSVRQKDQIHFLHFDGQFMPFASIKRCVELFKLVGNPFARLANDQTIDKYPGHQQRQNHNFKRIRIIVGTLD